MKDKVFIKFINVIKEFITDIEAAYPDNIDELERDWPDLFITYQHSKIALEEVQG